MMGVSCISVYSQRHICIQEKENGKSVQFANIYIGNSVYYSDKDGSVDIPDTVTSFKVSHICYADTVVALSAIKNNIVFLLPKTYDIPEVVVENKRKGKNKQQWQIGPIGKKNNLYFGGRSGMLVAVFIPYKKDYENKYIRSIVADLVDKKALVRGVYDSCEKAAVRFDLRLPDAKTNAPSSSSLIDGGVIYEGGSKGRTAIQLESAVPFPKSGVFVVLEWMVKGQCLPNVMYNPHLRMSKSNEQSVTWEKREYRQEDWVNWDKDAGMQQMHTYVHFKALNANIGLILFE